MPSAQDYCRRAAMVIMAVNFLAQVDAGVAGPLTSRIQVDLDIPEDGDGSQQLGHVLGHTVAADHQKRDNEAGPFSNTLNEAALAAAGSSSGGQGAASGTEVQDLNGPTPILIEATPTTATTTGTDLASGTPTTSAVAGQGKKKNNNNNNNNQRAGKGKGKRGKNNGKRNRSGRRRCRRRGRGKRNGKQNRAAGRRCRRRGGRRGRKNNRAKNNRANGVIQRAIEDGILTAYQDDSLEFEAVGVETLADENGGDVSQTQNADIEDENDFQVLEAGDDDSDDSDDGEDDDEEA